MNTDELWADPVADLCERSRADWKSVWVLVASASHAASLLSQVPGEEEDPPLTMAAAFLRVASHQLEVAHPEIVDEFDILELPAVGVKRETPNLALITLIVVAQGRLSQLEDDAVGLTREEHLSVRGAAGWLLCANLTLDGLIPYFSPSN